MITLQFGTGRHRFTLALDRLGLACRVPWVGELTLAPGTGLTADRWRDVKDGAGIRATVG